MIDIAIVGGGPAGLTAAIYASRAGYGVTVFERAVCGGQIVNTSYIENYPAAPGISGSVFAQALEQQARELGAEIIFSEITRADFTGEPKLLFAGGTEYQARAVILAAGATHRALGCPGEEDFTGRGVSYCATCDGNFFRGKEVAVVGGGNSALEDALFLSGVCSRVHLIHRRDSFRAAESTIARVCAADNVEPHLGYTVEGITGEKRMEAILLREIESGKLKPLPVAGLFVAVGLMPQNDWLEGQIELRDGYVIADNHCATSVPGVFAAGDGNEKELRQLVTAAADGAVAATSAADYLSRGEKGGA